MKQRLNKPKLTTKEITLKFSGVVRKRMGHRDRINFSFEDDSFGELLDALFAEYELEDMILDENRNVITWSRVAVNGRFSHFIGDLDAPI